MAFENVFGKGKKELIEEWRFNSKNPIVSSLVASNLSNNGENLIIFGTKSGQVFAISDKSEIKWLYKIKRNIDKIQAFFVDETRDNSIYVKPFAYDINNDGKKEILIGSDSGEVICLDINGKELWKFETQGKIRGMPFVAETSKGLMVVVTSTKGKIFWLDVNGNIVDERQVESGIESTPLFFKDNGKDRLVFGSNDGYIYCFNEQKEVLWRYKTQGKVSARPVITNLHTKDKIFIIIGSHDGFLYALDSFGNFHWKFKTQDKIVNEIALADFNKDGIPEIVFCSYDSNIYALNASGDLIWNYQTDFWIEERPIIEDIDNDGNQEVIVGSYDHSLYILDAQGSFLLNYVPGISKLSNQAGHFSDFVTSDPGQYKGKKLAKEDLGGIVIGTDLIIDKNKKKWIIVAVKNGDIQKFEFKTKG